MRRILWTLAVSTALGATVSWTMAQDRFAIPEAAAEGDQFARRSSSLSFGSGRTVSGASGTSREVPGRATTSRSTYSDLLGEPSSRPFPGESRTLPPAGSLSDTRAGDLFRRDNSRTSQSSGSGVTGEMLQDQFQQVSAKPADLQRPVVHAEYERLPGQRDQIEQIAGGDSARSFPQAVAQTSTPRGTATFSSFRSGSGTRLSDPISTSPTGRSFGTISANQPQVRSSRGVTFTRSTVPSQQSATSGIQQTAAVASPRPTVSPAVARTTTTGIDLSGKLLETVSSGPQAPSVALEWKTRSGINVGQESDCRLVVKNTGIIAVKDVEVTARFPTSVRLITVEPQPIASEEFLSWTFAELQPDEEHVIVMTMIPSEAGKLDATADVRFSGTAATALTVAEPQIEVQVAGPAKVLIGEPASQTVTVRNPGTGIATNVQIEAIIPAGLEHARGERLVMDVGSLNPGETRSVRLALAAVKGGNQVVQVQTRADGDLVRNATSEVFIVAPSLVTEIDGPGLRYLGRPAVYTLRVRNDGEINVDNVRVMHKMPEGFEVVETSRGAQFDRSNRLVNWFVGRLAAGQTSEMKVTVRPDQIGTFTHFVRATSEHGAISDAQFTTNVEGTPSLAMDIRDLDDPVEVGNETAYEIVIRNEGSAAARGVSLSCEIPAGLDVVNAQGPVDSIKQRDLVTFNPVIELAPGNSITYRVHIRGNVSGHHRLRARLSSESNPEPLTEDEVTRFYGE